MLNHQSDQFVHMETMCGSLLCELQKIWDEVGEVDVERDKNLVEIEQECLAVYRRKVDEAKMTRAQLQQAIAISEEEIKDVSSLLGEKPANCNQKADGNLKEKIKRVIPQLEEVRKRKMERKKQFVEVLDQLQKISNEMGRTAEDSLHKMVVDETDMSAKRLEEFHWHLLQLQNEKSNRLEQVRDHLNTLNSLCIVLGVDFKDLVCEIHPTLGDSKGTKDVSNSTIERLATIVQSLRETKIQRMQMLQDLATALLELWNLMDIPIEEQQMFQNVTCNIAASETEITEPNMLSMDFINYVQKEVLRLEQLKSSKMKELVLKRRLELEEICKRTHMVPEALCGTEFSVEAIESGSVNFVYLLELVDHQIAKAKEEAFSRKEILEKVEKWFTACEEECWLEEYNRDDNRYNARRGVHLTLRRAEKARLVVNKIPAMVEALISKATAWERERGFEFFYDGGRLLSMLEQYNSLRHEKEQERQRQRDKKRLQGQLITEQEALYGSKPSPSKSGTKASKTSMGVASDRRSLGGVMLQNPKPEKAALRVHSDKRGDSLKQSSHQHSGALAAHSGRRYSQIAGHLVKKQSSSAAKACETESPLVRKPLSPVSSIASSKANIANFFDQKKTQNGTLQRALPGSKTPMMTPPKSTIAGDEENRTPKTMPIPVPTTPSTVSAPMLMATTPATTCVSFQGKTVEKIAEQVEYSFEEARAGFICPLIYSIRRLQLG